jgi:hypothetical protein
MTDLDLLLLGCVVSFVAVAGAYVFIRERFTADERGSRHEPARVRSVPRKPRKAA